MKTVKAIIIVLLLIFCFPAMLRSEKTEVVIQERDERGASIAFAPDNQLVSSSENAMRLYDLHGNVIRIYREHRKTILDFIISRTGDTIISGSSDGEIVIRRITGEPVRRFNVEIDGKIPGMLYLSLRSTGTRFVFNSKYEIFIYDINKGLIERFKDPIGAHDIALLPDGQTVTYIDSNGNVKQVKLPGGTPKVLFKVKNSLGRLVVSPDGENVRINEYHGDEFVAFGQNKEIASVNNSNNGQRMLTMKFPDNSKSYTKRSSGGRVAISPDGEYIATSGNPSGDFLTVYRTEEFKHPSIDINKDTLYVWSCRAVKLSPSRFDRLELSAAGDYFQLSYKGISDKRENSFFAFSSDGSPAQVPFPTAGRMISSPDGSVYAYLANDKNEISYDYNTVYLYDSKGKGIKDIACKGDFLNVLRASPDGSVLAAYRQMNKETLINLIDIKKQERIGVIDLNGGSNSGTWVNDVYFINSSIILIHKKSDSEVWDLNAGLFGGPKKVKTLHGIYNAIAVNRMGDTIAAAYAENYNKAFSIVFMDKDYSIKQTITDLRGLDDIQLLAISRDGTRVAASDRKKGLAVIWDNKGNYINTVKTTGKFDSIDFSADGKYLATLDISDPFFKIWRIDTGDSISVATRFDQWIVFTDDGYFDGSQGAGDMIGITIGNKGYRVDQVATKYNRPDIIYSRMGMYSADQIAYFRAQYHKRLKKLGLTEADLNRIIVPPVARIQSFENSVSSGDKINLEFSDTSFNLKSYNIFINNVPLYGSTGKPLTGKRASVSSWLFFLNENSKIEVSCINAAGMESFRDVIFIEKKKKASSGVLYYIGFGVSKYKNAELNLKYADKDANDLAEYFGNKGDPSKSRKYFSTMNNPDYSTCKTKVYLNEDVTVDAVRDAKKYLLNLRMTSDDMVVIFLAGHGVHDNDADATYYFLTHNADLKNLKNTGAKFEMFEDLLDGLPARKKLLLLDTCESGESDEKAETAILASAQGRGIKARTSRAITVVKKEKGSKPRGNVFSNKDRFIFNDLSRRTGAIVFASCRGGEFSYESDQVGNGFFTKSLIKVLMAAPYNGIEFNDLKTRVIQEVGALSGDMQHPVIDRSNIYLKIMFNGN